ncbi:RNA exonuclease 1 homolog [Syngnathoides biaculeatus]|uniref:RNA exonuclease 1 homolog n=1 Tax=Syngnathoides biaculeatus TaxID=300417 RepID=UPI002ADD7572|nr:RNA exonuclease 1 homolog [Syngnathoides biaculeatus]XP_061681627.1 RNA exonuclease 1 homolog [Syngnathoides biaculeatus]
MLRSTGFFRGLDCPFYTEYTEGSGNGCNRPYCHFRHKRQNYGASVEPKKLHAAQKEQGYDPYKPEVVRPQEHQNGTSPHSGDITGALEIVNKAIEEVRNEVEREKKKLSRIGDEPYIPSGRTSASYADNGKGQTPGKHLAYDPGSYQMTSGGYNPTPSCSKYTLDSDSRGSSSNSMEYVPTSLKKNPSRTHTQAVPTPPPSPKYSTTSSSMCKYTVDTSRPSTDMEYDPLSNYSAGIAVKRKWDGSTCNISEEVKKTHRLPISDDAIVPIGKKVEQQHVDTNKYTFSDSDGESSGTEYRPTSLSSLQQRKANSVTKVGDNVEKERKESGKGTLQALSQSNKEDLETREHLQQKSCQEKKKVKIDKSEKAKDGQTSLNRKSIKEKGKESQKKSHQDSTKKENKSHSKNDDRKKSVKVKTPDKVTKEHKRGDQKVNSKPNSSDSSERHKVTEINAGESRKSKILDKEQSKQNERKHKNGQLNVSKRHKDEKKLKKRSATSATSKVSSAISKGKTKHSISPKCMKSLELKQRTLNLSHADLFGDESAEEAEPIVVDDSNEELEEVPVRKCADALKRGGLNKRKASELTLSSSEDEDDKASEGGGIDKDAALDLSIFQDELDFGTDPMEECLRIFNESKDVKKENKGRQAKQPSRDSEDDNTESTLTTLFPGQKKRVSHFVSKGNTDAPSKNVVRPYRRPTAQEVCYQRMQMAQQQAAQLSASVKVPSQSSPSPSSSGERKRIAHRPNPLTISSKTSTSDTKTAGSLPVRTQTTAGILSKTTSTTAQKRVAHTPTMKSSSMTRPIIPSEFGAKIPTIIRQRYLNIFIDECIKFCPSEDVAFQMGLVEEKLVYERSNTKKIYLNVAVNTLKKLRNKSSSCSSSVLKEASLPPSRKAQSHEDVLGGRLAATTSFTVNRMGKQQEENLNGAVLYQKLKAYLMTEEQLQEHGYPRINPNALGKAVVYNLPEKKVILDPFTKICCRCGAEYKVNVKGNCLRKEECAFHWGRLRRQKVAGSWETMYSCCSGAVGSPGCQLAQQHVQDGRKESLDGFVTTFSKALPRDGNGGVFALDCEMCYTKQGLELTRVTVINSDLKVIYDTFVKPESKVVDFNTRFSGVTAEDLDGATITLRDVQAVLLSMFSAESILVGHSLESDLLALKLIHSSVVDTALVFPHRLGLPYKRALRNLMADYLKRIIQDSVDGHDSSEDASACMELMIWKLKEDAKVKR